jgi:hypothetical protein
VKQLFLGLVALGAATAGGENARAGLISHAEYDALPAVNAERDGCPCGAARECVVPVGPPFLTLAPEPRVNPLTGIVQASTGNPLAPHLPLVDVPDGASGLLSCETPGCLLDLSFLRIPAFPRK